MPLQTVSTRFIHPLRVGRLAGGLLSHSSRWTHHGGQRSFERQCLVRLQHFPSPQLAPRFEIPDVGVTYAQDH